MNTIDPELLMRYADDDVSEADRRLVEARLRTDRQASDLVATFRSQSAQLRALAPELDDDLALRRCERKIDDALAERIRLRSGGDARRWVLPIAASVLIALIGGVLSLQFAERRVETEIARFLADQADDYDLVTRSRSEALERMVSGSPLSWANEKSGTRGSITPLGTFQTSDGAWCREFEEVIVSSVAEQRRLGIACRQDDGDWRPPLEPSPGI